MERSLNLCYVCRSLRRPRDSCKRFLLKAKNLAELSLSFIVFGHARFFVSFFLKKKIEIIFLGGEF